MNYTERWLTKKQNQDSSSTPNYHFKVTAHLLLSPPLTFQAFSEIYLKLQNYVVKNDQIEFPLIYKEWNTKCKDFWKNKHSHNRFQIKISLSLLIFNLILMSTTCLINWTGLLDFSHGAYTFSWWFDLFRPVKITSD